MKSQFNHELDRFTRIKYLFLGYTPILLMVLAIFSFGTCFLGKLSVRFGDFPFYLCDFLIFFVLVRFFVTMAGVRRL